MFPKITTGNVTENLVSQAVPQNTTQPREDGFVLKYEKIDENKRSFPS